MTIFERAAGITLAMEMATHIAETLRSRSGHVGELTLRQIVKFGGTSIAGSYKYKVSMAKPSLEAVIVVVKKAKYYHCSTMGHIRCVCHHQSGVK